MKSMFSDKSCKDKHTASIRGFFLWTGVFFSVCTSTLGAFDLLPEAPSASAHAERSYPTPLSDAVEASTPTPRVHEDILPRRIVIDAIDLRASIETPTTTDSALLDQALLAGAVLYPGSGTLSDISNLLVFGHSSALPVVHNRNFKIFNRLKELRTGDVIRIQSNTHEHLYRVTSVTMARAEDVKVRFDVSEKRLTLATCNSFGDKADRYVVEAAFIGSYPISP